MRPADVRLEFETIAWESPGPNVRFKAIRKNGVQLRLLEFSRGFVEHDWCSKKHIGYVLAGELALEMPEGTVRVRAGEGIVLSGPDAKHKASALTDTVTLFLVEDA
jgi:quercetin dioxygenase-like cupin family protein